jgi:ATP synthase, Delta/Epsilon chain, beta-sandwich domain
MEPYTPMGLYSASVSEEAYDSHDVLGRKPALADDLGSPSPANSSSTTSNKMSSFRMLSSVARRAPSFALGRRGYADISDKLKLTFVLPHKVRRASVFYRELATQYLVRSWSP